MAVYRVNQGETLDYICFKHYGSASGFVEKVLAANYRLADHMLALPAGLEIVLPEIKDEPTETLISLWD